jgi:hypothetical protein
MPRCTGRVRVRIRVGLGGRSTVGPQLPAGRVVSAAEPVGARHGGHFRPCVTQTGRSDLSCPLPIPHRCFLGPSPTTKIAGGEFSRGQVASDALATCLPRPNACLRIGQHPLNSQQDTHRMAPGRPPQAINGFTRGSSLPRRRDGLQRRALCAWAVHLPPRPLGQSGSLVDRSSLVDHLSITSTSKVITRYALDHHFDLKSTHLVCTSCLLYPLHALFMHSCTCHGSILRAIDT